MAVITIADLRARFSEFADDTEYTDSMVQFAIDDAVASMAEEAEWCNSYERAQLFLSAHFLVLDSNASYGDAGTTGKIQSKGAGGVSVSYAQNAAANNRFEELYGSTIYGQRYLSIVNICFPNILVAR